MTLTTFITILILIALYILSIRFSERLLYNHFYLRCKNELIDNSEENVKRVCKEYIEEEKGLCYIPILNSVIVFILSIMISIEQY